MIALQKNRGFTLFELLVAMSIFALVSYMAYTGLLQVLDAREHTQRVENRLAKLQMTFLSMGRDIQHMTNRPVRSEYGDELLALKGGELGDYRIELTRTGHRNPARAQRSLLQRIAYFVEEEKLYRVTWPALDRAQNTEARRTMLLDKTESLEIRFLENDGEWLNEWPSTNGQADIFTLPRAVAIKLTLPDMGVIDRIFILPEA